MTVDEMTDAQLVDADAALQVAQLSAGNLALAELLNAGRWLSGCAFASGACFGLSVGQALAGGSGAVLVLAAGALIAGGICVAGAEWHRKRANRCMANGRELTEPLAAIRRELARRAGP